MCGVLGVVPVVLLQMGGEEFEGVVDGLAFVQHHEVAGTPTLQVRYGEPGVDGFQVL